MANSARSSRTPPGWLETWMRTFRRWWAVTWRSLQLPTHRHALGWWLGTRGFLFLVWAVVGFQTQGDVIYYYQSIYRLFHGAPASAVLIEYPTPLIWLLTIPYVLGWGTMTGYILIFVFLFVAGDALMGYVLWRSARQFGTNPRPAAAFWIWFVLLMGPITYMRLDFLTAALTAAGLVAVVRKHRLTSGAMVGLGAAIKLWPALMWPATMGDKRAVKRASVGFFGMGAAMAIASLVYAGWKRLISPLTWQSDRGLQIESIYATPAMIARLFDPFTWQVADSKYNAFQISGPGTVFLTEVASAATVLGGVVMIVLYIGWLRRRDRTPIEAGTLMVIATLIMIITNKTFSPQYMIWLTGPVAVLLTISAKHPDLLPRQGHLFSRATAANHLTGRDHLLEPLTLARRITMWILFLTALTQLIYPVMYRHLILVTWFTPAATAVLAVRNVGLAYFSVRLIILAFRSISFPRTRPRPDRKAVDPTTTEIAEAEA